MTFIPGQRPVAPWRFHHWWGQWSTAAALPNVAGSDDQYNAEIQAGDLAWVVDVASLYVCTDPTPAAAVWAQIASGGSSGGVQPFGFFDGTGPSIFFQNAGIVSIIRTPAGDPAGDYRVTLTTPVPITIAAPPAASTGKYPYVPNLSGASNPVNATAEIVGVSPYTQVRVRISDAAAAKVDAFFSLSLIPF